MYWAFIFWLTFKALYIVQQAFTMASIALRCCIHFLIHTVSPSLFLIPSFVLSFTFPPIISLIYFLPSVPSYSLLWPVKIVPDMTYNVFGGTLNLALSIYPTPFPSFLFSRADHFPWKFLPNHIWARTWAFQWLKLSPDTTFLPLPMENFWYMPVNAPGHSAGIFSFFPSDFNAFILRAELIVRFFASDAVVGHCVFSSWSCVRSSVTVKHLCVETVVLCSLCYCGLLCMASLWFFVFIMSTWVLG